MMQYWSMQGIGMFYRYWAGVIQVHFTYRSLCMYHAWNNSMMIQVYYMHSTGVFYSCTMHGTYIHKACMCFTKKGQPKVCQYSGTSYNCMHGKILSMLSLSRSLSLSSSLVRMYKFKFYNELLIYFIAIY